ncbi:peptidase M28 [Gemmatimonadetes bacterium T265]|nr:peptidase M28 [Gemmatimonadetes bacterium T265]
MTRARAAALVVAAVALPAAARAQPATSPAPADAGRLVAALAGETPLASDLAELTDRIGGRPTGGEANRRAVAWGVDKFRAMGVAARAEPFPMPGLWLERSASATVEGAGVRFSPRVAAMPFSTATPAVGTTAPLVDAGRGTDADFARLGPRARGAFVLVEQDELKDIDGLFKEYADAADVERRAFAAGVAGVVYMGSRPNDLLYRHNVNVNWANTRLMLVMDRDGALRAMRLLRAGLPLAITERLDLERGPAFESANVVGEIRGATRPDEVVVVGAHLDSWDLGTGALDNGANVALVLDIARQVHALGVRPARTMRFVLWNGEEQGMYGSAGYVRTHAAELDRTAMTLTFDIGCGRITGFYTGGRPDVVAATTRAVAPVAGYGPFTQVDQPLVGTDNFDFMLAGVPNLVANQEPATYGPNYHARSDEFGQCDLRQLRQNAQIAGAVMWAAANAPGRPPRQSSAEVADLFKRTDLAQQMVAMGVWDEYARAKRGVAPVQPLPSTAPTATATK